MVRLQAVFRSYNADGSAGSLFDPDTVTFKRVTPNGTQTSVTYPTEIVRASEGIYYLDFTAAIPGLWRYRIEADSAAIEDQFFVNVSIFT